MERGQQQGIIPLKLNRQRLGLTASWDELAELLEEQREAFTRKAVTHGVRLREGQERKRKYLIVSLKSQPRQLGLQGGVLAQQ